MTASGPADFPAWTPESPADDDFQAIAAQARFGVQQKVVDEAARRKRLRLFAAGGIAIVVAAAIVLLIEKFYDPAARARQEAIATQVQQMAQQQKVTDNLTLIEIDIENAIMANDFDTARKELDNLIARSPDHPRREFLKKSIERAEELAKLSPQNVAKNAPTAASAAPVPAPVAAKPRLTDRAPQRAAERPATRAPERSSSTRSAATSTSAGPRTYGAPVGEPLRQPTIALNAPINAPPTLSSRRPDSSFSGRTIEAGDAPRPRRMVAPRCRVRGARAA